MSLIMTVNTPQDGATVTSSPATVSGSLSKNAEVKINGVPLPGKVAQFSQNVPLTAGQNTITIVAKSSDPEQTVTRTVTVTYSPAQ